jgi:hypothetical protein
MVLRRKSPDERGATLVLASILMVTMLVFAAIAVDIANGRQVHRQARATADAAALAGAQDLPDGPAVVTVVKDYVETNMDIVAADWVGCTDADHLTDMPDYATNTNECISFDEGLTQVRVSLPITEVDTTFANVIGVSTLDVSGAAIAEANLTRDDRVIPATVAASAGSGNLCIENSGNDAACAARTSGNFGSFASPRVSLYKPTSQVQNNSLRINYSMGVDHALSIYSSGTTKVCDGPVMSPCGGSNLTSADDANYLEPATGNMVPPLTDGVVDNATVATETGTFLFCGRLRRPDLTDTNIAETDPENCDHWDTPTAGPSINVVGENINGRHVSYWMKSEFKNMFFGAGATPAVTPSTDASWATGDNILDCFMRAYRFDYTGVKGYALHTEFFIDPTTAINPLTGDGTHFTTTQAKDYLKLVCGMDAATVDAKLLSGNDNDNFWPMFDYEMVTDPRFGMIPVVDEFEAGGSTAMRIVRFWGTFMYRLYSTSTNVKALDGWTFETALIETPDGIPTLQFGYQPNQPVVHLIK